MSGRNRILISINFGLLFFILFSPCLAQVSISGRVTSKAGALGSVRIELRAEEDSRILAYTFSNAEGKYLLKFGAQANLYLSFRALTYEPVSKKIQDLKSDTIVNAQLVPGAVERLEEVFVHTKRPHRRGRDTIELDVKSFLLGDERTVEDLLRKIPGINVGVDGSIKIGDKEVEKVMVEGDDFFEKGYRLLTQSMSVQPLEKVQVLQRYSNNKHLKGIENSEKVALNLQLKADSKNQWMGSVLAQGAPVGPKYYQVGANLMNFGKKNKYYLLGAANNNGIDAVSSINHLINSGSAKEPGQVGSGISTPTLIDNTPDLPGFDHKRTNFNQDRLISLNTILNPIPTLKIKWMGFINPTKKSFYHNTIQEYHIDDIQFSNTENFEFKRRINNYFSKLELQYDHGKQSTLSYSGTLGSLGRQDIGELLFNGTGSTEFSKSQGILTNHNLSHTYKLSDNKALVSSVRFISQNSPLNYSIDHYYYKDLFGLDSSISGIGQHVENSLSYLGATSHYLARQKRGDFFELALVSEYKKQRLSTDFHLQAKNGSNIQPEGFSNDLTFDLFHMDLIAKYTIKRKNWEITPLLRTGIVHNRLDKEDQLNKSNFLLSPNVLVKWFLYRKGMLEADFALQQRPTSLTELIPNYYSTGIRNFTKGLADMTMLNSSEGQLTYSHGDMLDRFFARLSTGYSIMFNYMGQKNSIDPNFNLMELVLLKNKVTTFYKGEFNYYLNLLQGNIRLDLGYNKADYESVITGLGNRLVNTTSYDYGISFRSVWKSRLNIYAGYKVRSVTYQTEEKTTLKNNQGILNLFLNLAKDLQCNLKNESYRFGSFLGQNSKTYFFSDFSLSYDLKKMRTRFDLTAKNMFNTRRFVNTVLTDTYLAATEYRLLPRYVSFGIDYNF